MRQFSFDPARFFGSFHAHAVLQKVTEKMMVTQEKCFISHRQHKEIIALDLLDHLIPVLPLQTQCLANDPFTKTGVKLLQ